VKSAGEAGAFLPGSELLVKCSRERHPKFTKWEVSVGLQVNNVAALLKLPKVDGGQEGYPSSSAWTILITGHGLAVRQTMRPVLDSVGAEDCVCGCLVATLQDFSCVYPKFQDHVGRKPEYKHVGMKGTGTKDKESAV
jgi:hypothetical protein